MTNEEISLRIARECGWHSIHTSADGLKGMKGALRGFMLIPDFCTDLNAMLEAADQIEKLRTALKRIRDCNWPGPNADILSEWEMRQIAREALE